jgi:hypothetical protein
MPKRLQAFPLSEAWPSRRAVGLVALALVSGSGLAASRVAAQSEEQAVIQAATHFFDGMRARDTAMMRSTIIPLTQVVIPGGTTGIALRETADQFIAGVGKGTGPGGDEVMRDPKVQIDGPMASLWAYYTYTEGGQTKIDHCGIDTFLLRKGPDGWKIFHLAGTIRKTGCVPIPK